MFLSSKLTMGMLSEGPPWCSAAERALVARYLPWTRVLTDRRTHRGDRTVELVRFAHENRESLVLKESLGMSGKQVLIGRHVDQSRWDAALDAAARAGTSVVQDYVPPQSCPLPIIADGADEPVDTDIAPVFGPLLFGGRPAGMWARFFGDGREGVVSVLGNRSSDNCVVAV